jgi:ABC-type transport system involved in multi-copper enzyme maturation permease subunit
MFHAILRSQWRWCRLVIVLGTVAGFSLPVLSLQGATRGEGAMPPDALLRLLQSWGILYPLLAGLLGLLVAMAAWAPDHRGRHVHALTLPLPRWRYVLLRFAAGLTVLALPVAAVFFGAVLATATAAIPPGLQGYPLALGLRFALAVLVAFSLFFAISGGTARTAGIILGVLALVVVAQILVSAAGVELDLLGGLQQAFLNWPGPLAIFSGRWMLIDV